MAKATITIPQGYDDRVKDGTTITLDLPEGSKEDFVEKSVKDYLDSRYGPNVTKKPPVNVQPVGYTGDPASTSPVQKQTGTIANIRNLMMGSGPKPANIPILSPALKSVEDAVHAPISGKSGAGRAADVIEGAGTLASIMFAPQIGANPLAAIKGALGVTAGNYAGRGISNVFSNDPETQRLGGDIGGLAGGALSQSPKLTSLPVLKGAYKGAVQGTTNTLHYRGINLPAPIAGGAIGDMLGYYLGTPKSGMAIGAAYPTISGAIKGGIAGGADQPFIPPEISSMFRKSPIDAEWAPSVGEQMNNPPYKHPQLSLPAGPSPINVPPDRTFNMPPPMSSQGAEVPTGIQGNSPFQMPPAGMNDIVSQPVQKALPPALLRQYWSSGNQDLETGPYPIRTRGAIPIPGSTRLGEITRVGGEITPPKEYPTIPVQQVPPVQPPGGGGGSVVPPQQDPLPIPNEELPNLEEVREVIKNADESLQKGETPKETKPAEKSPSNKEVGDKGEKATDAKPVLKEIHPEFDKILGKIDPSWSPEKQVSHEHLYKIADAMGVKATPLARKLAEVGYDVQPSKFGDGRWGVGRIGKKDIGDLSKFLGPDKLKEIMEKFKTQ